MKVNLLTKTPDALKTAFTAIRTCYSPYDQEYVWNEDWDNYVKKNNDHIRLVKQIVNHGHTSTLEHINFTFSINDVSRSLLAQLTRHRIGFAYSVQSQRYVKMETEAKAQGFDFITPPSILENEEALSIYNTYMEETQATYDKLRELGILAEDARYMLPNAATTNITLTCNLRAFIDLYKKRNSSTHAQWEIAELVEKMKEIILEEESWISEII